jgi:iron complex transport system substrate-binding protein
MGLPVLGVIAEDLEELKTSMIILGKRIGRERAALEFAEYYDSAIQEVKAKTSRIKKEERPVVYLAGPMGILSTCSRDMYQTHLIELCGGTNASAELTGFATRHGWTEVSAEQLISWNPHIILSVQYGGPPREKVLNDPRWQRIDAIKQKKVIMFPSALNPWDYPSPQAILGIKWLAKTLHPELFGEIDMRKEADDFYRRFYGKSFTALGGRL